MHGEKIIKTVICPICEKEWDFRVGFAHQSLYRHMKDAHR